MTGVGIKITAQDATRAAFNSVEQNLTTLQSSARSMAGALASIGTGISLGAFVTMTKQIVDGLDAMNDLKDATGASIENISALEDIARRAGTSFDTVSTSLIKLNQGLNSAKPGSDTEAALKAIGLSVKELKDLDPAEAFLKIATSLSGFADDSNKARLTQELFGKSLKEVAPLLKDVAESGRLSATVTTAQAEAAENLNKQMFSLQKNALDMGRAFTSSVIPALAEGVERFILAHKHAGSLLGVLAMYARLDYGKNVQGNLGEIEQQIARLEERATRITSTGSMAGNNKMIADLKAQAAFLKELRINKILEDTTDTSDAVSRKYLAPKKSVGDLPPKPEKPKAAPKDTANEFAGEQEAAKEWAKAMEAAGKASADLTAKNEGLSKSEAELKNYMESTAAALNDKTNPAMNDMVRAAYEATIELEKLADARKAIFDAVDNQQKKTSTAQEETAKERERVAAIGLTTEAMAELTATRLEEMATAKERTLLATDEIDLSGAYSEAVKEEVAALRERAGLIRTGATKEAGLETAKQVAAEWQRGWQATDQLAREVFADWAVDGSSAAKKIGDVLKKALLSAIYEATLKPIVFQVYGSIMGGGVGTASTASQMASSGSSMFGGAGSTLGAFGGAFGSGMSLGAEAFMPGIEMMTGATGMSSFMAGAGQAAGAGLAAAGPYVLAALAIKSLTDYNITPNGNAIIANVGAGGASAVAARSDFAQTSAGIFSGGNTQNSSWADADAGTRNYIDANVKAITEANRAYGNALGLSSAALETYTSQIEINTTGMDSAAAKAAIDAALTQFAADQASAAFGTAVDAFKQGSETTSQTLARLGTDLTTVNQWAEFFGTTLNDVSVIGAAAAATLVDAFGGLDKLNASLSTYYQNYYTEEEQRQRTIAGVQTSLSTAGIDLSIEQLNGATKEGVRAWVDVAKSLYDAGIFTAAQLEAAISAANAMAPIAHANSEASATEQQRKIEEEKKLHEHDDDPWWWLFRGTQSYGGADGNTGGGDGTTRPMGSGPNGSGPAAGSDANGFQNTIKNWLDKLDSTDAGIESVMRKRDVAWASYKTQLSLAQGNDAEALSGITGYADTLITSIKESSKTLLEEQLGIARVKEQVGGLVTTKPEDVVAGAVTKSGQNIVDALFGISTLLGGSGGSGGSGQAGFGNAPRTVPIVPLPIIISAPTAQAPPNNSGMEEALRKMATRLEAIETNTGLGAVAAGSTRSILDELSNGARALKTRAA